VIDFIKENNVKKFAEIGVWKAKFCKRVLESTGDQIEEYWAIDPWDINLAFSQVERRRTPLKWFQMHYHCCSQMMYFPQLKVVKMTSEQACEIFPDGYFDMVYIDTVHTFDHVWADIEYWLPKVRKGGIIGGHDYGYRGWPEVKEAVDKYFGEENLEEISRADLGVWAKRL